MNTVQNTIRSNKLVPAFCYDHLNKDYDIFMVSTSEQYIPSGAAFLDCEEKPDVRAIAYESGKTFYILTTGGSVTKNSLIAMLRSYEEGDTLSLREVRAEEVKPHILLQLLLNGLNNPSHPMLRFNNLTGKLLCYRPEWINRDKDDFNWGLTCVEVHMNEDMACSLRAHQMSSIRLRGKMDFKDKKRQFRDFPQYRFANHHQMLKRAGEQEHNADGNFIMKPLKDEHAQVGFLNFASWDEFQMSKIGVLYDLYGCIEKELSEYVRLDFQTYPITKTLPLRKADLDSFKDVIGKSVREKRIRLVDEVQSSTSEAYLGDIAEKLREMLTGVEVTVGKRISSRCYNICYIYDRPHYEELSAADPHTVSTNGAVVQHITVENFDYHADAAVMNVLKEMVIKNDVMNGKISLVDWPAFGFTGDWIFGIKKESVKKNDLKAEATYWFMTIHPNGGFEISGMERNLFNYSAFDELMDYFDDVNVMGVVQNADGARNLIRKTALYSVPEFERVGDILKREAARDEVGGIGLLSVCRGIQNTKLSDQDRQNLEELIGMIDEEESYGKKEILGQIRSRSLKQKISEGLYEDTGVLLKAYLRSQGAREQYLHGVVDINYSEIDDTHAIYCVGDIGSGMKQKLERAAVIREIEAVGGSDLIFEELLPLMGVEFVRYGQLTVIPFPFKYLREGIKIAES